MIGTHINHQGEEEQVELVYRTVSGGTAVEERIFAGYTQRNDHGLSWLR